ncbi:ABC-2 type transport system permease protein [Lipingzhangella halophila]|uniref:ABC-2 type transport system permease protein n=1 Tax=Lipingzhangella halophila TaxID=1783352 RepID=A0A7W7W461_9ACTN|nr:ABC transporter permease [Lipingzhangella halophila]MBB4933777.1 ABC-2 type transport system permease protein [Lipingzhangella halophila]
MIDPAHPAKEEGVAAPEGAADAPSLRTVASTEASRLWRRFPLWLTFGLPLGLVLPQGLVAALSPEGRQGFVWDVWLQVVLMFWGVLLPMATALYAGVAVRQDNQARRLLYSYGFPRSRLLLGKFAALAGMSLLCAMLLTCLLCLLGVLFGETGGIARIVAGGMVPWLASLATLALCLVVAHVWGFTATMCTGVAGMMFGALLADKAVWWIIPLAWPMRVVVPLAGIEASGVPLPDGHPLNDPSVLPIAVGLSVALAAVLLVAGSRYVNRKEL